MHDNQLFSDRQGDDDRPLTDVLPPDTLRGVIDLIDAWVGRGIFSETYPETCPDANSVVCGTDRNAVDSAVRAIVPGGGWPWRAGALPPQNRVFDVVEFLWRAASAPTVRTSHPFFKHDHLASFDRRVARGTIETEVNLLLSRCHATYRLSNLGRVERSVVPEVESIRAVEAPRTPDEDFNSKVETAMVRYSDHSREERLRAVEEMWDAFERGKTLFAGGDKRVSAEAFVGTQPTDIQGVLRVEMRTLTEMGNNFQIRHHEKGRPRVPSEYLDYVFVRVATVVRLMQKALESDSRS